MRVLSFDIGTKNLAYCVIDVNLEEKSVNGIVEWEIINIYDDDEENKIHNRKCDWRAKGKDGKCGVLSKYYFLESCDLLDRIVKSRNKKKCKGKKKDDVIDEEDGDDMVNTDKGICRYETCDRHYGCWEKEMSKLGDIGSSSKTLINFSPYDNRKLKCRRHKKDKNAKYYYYKDDGSKDGLCNVCNKGDIGLSLSDMGVEIREIMKKQINHDEFYGRLLRKLNSRLVFRGVDEVVIEHQPGFGTRLMDNVQIFLYSYFFIPGDRVVSLFNPTHKFDFLPKERRDSLNLERYSDRKEMSENVVKDILVSGEWYDFFISNARKADDLGDCYIQALTYVNRKYGVIL